MKFDWDVNINKEFCLNRNKSLIIGTSNINFDYGNNTIVFYDIIYWRIWK